MATKEKAVFTLFVGNIPYDVTEPALQAVFAEAGEVSKTQIITDKFSGRSKGFGFIEVSSKAAMNKCIKEIHEKEINGRKLVVQEAKPREKQPATEAA